MFKFRYKKTLAFCLMLNISLATTNCMESKIVINEINKEEMKQKASNNLKKAKTQVDNLIEAFFMRIADYISNKKNNDSDFNLDNQAKSIFDQILDLHYSYNFDNATKKQIELIREIMKNNFLSKKFEPKDFSLWFGYYLLLCKYSLYDISCEKKYSKFNKCIYKVQQRIVNSNVENREVYGNILSSYRCIMEINRFWSKQRTSDVRLKFKNSDSNLIFGFRLRPKWYTSLYADLCHTEATSWNVLYQIYYLEFDKRHKYLDEYNEQFNIYDIASEYGFMPINDMLMVKDKKKYGKISFRDYLFTSSRNYSKKERIGFVNYMFNDIENEGDENDEENELINEENE